MLERERAEIVFKLRNEYQTISRESKELKEAILQQADAYQTLSDQLRSQLDYQKWDRQILVADAERLCDRVASYQKLLPTKAALRERLEAYKDFFAPLE